MPSSTPTTQQAVAVNGPANTVSVVQIPRPTLSDPHDLLVSVRGVATNPVDTFIRMLLQLPSDQQFVIGHDTAGVVKAVGSSVQGFKVGDAVFWCGSVGRASTFAEEVLVDHRAVAHKPANLSFPDAAALAMATQVAWPVLYTHLHIDQHVGEWIYIHSGSSGMGSMAVQLAKVAGLKVISSAGREESRAWVQKMGAEHVLDHSKELKPQLAALNLSPVKLIFNAYTDESLGAILPLLTNGGHVVSVNFERDASGMPKGLPGAVVMQLFLLGATLSYQVDLAGAGPKQVAWLDAVAKLINEGKLKPISGHPGHSFKGFDGIVEAEKLQAGKHAIGKIVVDLQ